MHFVHTPAFHLYPGEQALQLYAASPIKGVGLFVAQFPTKAAHVQGKLTR